MRYACGGASVTRMTSIDSVPRLVSITRSVSDAVLVAAAGFVGFAAGATALVGAGAWAGALVGCAAGAARCPGAATGVGPAGAGGWPHDAAMTLTSSTLSVSQFCLFG